MRTEKMSDAAVLRDKDSMEREYASDRARRIATRWIVGRTRAELAKLIGYQTSVIDDALKLYAFESTAGVEFERAPGRKTESAASHGHAKERMRKVFSKHAPSKSEVHEEDVEYYTKKGYAEDVATTLVRAEVAAESAIESGELRESHNKRGERILKVHLDKIDDWNMRIRRAMTEVRSAAGFLNRAGLPDIKRRKTVQEVARAHAAWMAEIARVRKYHKDFDKLVQDESADDKAVASA